MTFKGEGRPNVYKVNGKRVSGVTTILGQFTDPGGLIHWAFKTGQEHPEWTNPYGGGAAEIGTVCHSMVEKWIHKEDPNESLQLLDNEPEKREGALLAFNNFVDWFDMTGLRITHTEVPLQSDTYGFGGTIDAMAIDSKDRVCLIDWKSSNSIYPDHLMQLAAYGVLWEDNHPGVKVDAYHLCRFAKTSADFHHHSYQDLDEARELFLKLVECHGLKKEVKKRAQ